MKITITGSLGNISKPLVAILTRAGHQVTVISSRAEQKSAIEALGAQAAIGLVSDADFLTRAFTGADAVYTMVPPNLKAADYQAYSTGIVRAYGEAIARSGVKQVVNLSSMGAHLAEGTGPIKVMHENEAILDALQDTAVRHLRPPFFYTNFYGNTEMIRHMGVLGGNYPASSKLLLIHPRDIAAAAAEELQKGFTGHSVRHLAGDVRTNAEVAAVLGRAIARPELPWVEFTDDQSYQGMLQAGFSTDMAALFVEMGGAVRQGDIWEKFSGQPLQGVRLEEFAVEFAGVFAAV